MACPSSSRLLFQRSIALLGGTSSAGCVSSLPRSIAAAAAGAAGPSSSSSYAAAAAAAWLPAQRHSYSSSCVPGPLFSGQPNSQQRWQQQQWQQHIGGSGTSPSPSLPPSSSSSPMPPPPSLCGHPKDKISRHRASLRRRIYYRKPQHNLAVCKFCQAAASPHTFLQGSGRCNGRCIDDADGGRGGGGNGGGIEKEGGGGGRYRAEYVPPC